MYANQNQPLSKENGIFDYHPPKAPIIGILSIPHSGEIRPQEFSSYLIDDFDILSRDVDTGVHQLVDIETLNQAGIAVLKANVHRACVDLNRAPEECVLNWKQNSRGETLVLSEPDDQTRALLTQKYHAPYFEMIKALVYELGKTAKKPSFIDLHSMPSRPTAYHLSKNPKQEKERPDFCLSDIEGLSCAKEFIDFAQAQLLKSYSKVYQNNPYFGGYVTRHVNERFPETNNIQIEIKRGLYLNEEKRELEPSKAGALKPVLTKALIEVFEKFAPRK